MIAVIFVMILASLGAADGRLHDPDRGLPLLSPARMSSASAEKASISIRKWDWHAG